ncbi:hypothetical protein THC_0715 [Caldimicrobium thiodismutans]|uniref:Uncharacterized protein n=1 Tax=Caldimicrobium thiodismutans TaxID=1653476 RepID=A0A0U5AGJ5_9BACT|nr:hypothetical protein THC_0715 [Caldimicrobium thiodismutans]
MPSWLVFGELPEGHFTKISLKLTKVFDLILILPHFYTKTKIYNTTLFAEDFSGFGMTLKELSILKSSYSKNFLL